MPYVKYSSNNSGGYWWLTDDDWRALEADGWKVNWVKDRKNSLFISDEADRWLGALATSAELHGVTLMEAVERWEAVTNATATDVGCTCCGNPHVFYEYGEDGRIKASGPDISYSASF